MHDTHTPPMPAIACPICGAVFGETDGPSLYIGNARMDCGVVTMKCEECRRQGRVPIGQRTWRPGRAVVVELPRMAPV
jgi:hypothetical protein